MTAQLVLIAAILVLGGVIATVGDRLGMRIGKARLSLFRLRPRQTATIITILTGSIISASTFALLFALSEQLRRGVFEYEKLQEHLSTAQDDLEEATVAKREVERELNQSTRQQNLAQRRLAQINRSLQGAIAQQEKTEAQLNRTQTQLRQAQSNFQHARTLLQTVSQQAIRLRSEIQQLQSERQALIQQQRQVRAQITQRDQEIAQRDQALVERDQAIGERESLLKNLEEQRAFLMQEVQTLEREFQGLRQGNVALLRNQSLSTGVVRIVAPNAARQAVNQLLREANQMALQRVRPGAGTPDQQVIQITNAEVEQLISQIQDGQDYVIRILAKGNYVVGEPCVLAGEACVQVYASAALNQIVFVAGEAVAVTTADPTTMTNERLIERLNLLIAAAQFRARQSGILSETIQVADGRTETIIAFFDQLKAYNQPVEIQAIAADLTYTAGPLRIELQAVQDGQILFNTQIQDPQVSSNLR